MKNEFIGYPEALKLTLSHITPLQPRAMAFSECTDHISGEDLRARVDVPSVDVSLKDGYAVRSEDVAKASAQSPVELEISDTAAAGVPSADRVLSGTTVRVLTGAKIPEGADAVVSEEYVQQEHSRILVFRDAEPGRNILPRGTDVRKGEIILRAGDILTPGRVGLAVASGYATISAVPKPRVAILATGDEVLYPGAELEEGKLYASNMAALNAWCSRLNMDTRMDIVSDNEKNVSEKLDRAAGENDAVLTSGGAWMGDRDLVVRTLVTLGWEKVYHRVRMGPGKGAGFGFLKRTPVFVLPGGPPSNLTAFLFLALPGLMKMAGYSRQIPPLQPVRLKEPVKGKKDWTRFVFGELEQGDQFCFFIPHRMLSRLRSMAEARCIITIPEAVDGIPEGTTVMGTMLE
ncbi:MAG: molybdopterin molybdotransferase MoeA [Deltaproteobacteria bacterium]|nr:molybdopterin molybdotransferase MoeA [Deltaproteobacteria bacterium]MBW2153467.1 molybdopterin molybdotransferase MoeA [Deltaproteobacteria bacterium]